MKKATAFMVVLVMSMVWMLSCGKSNVQTIMFFAMVP